MLSYFLTIRGISVVLTSLITCLIVIIVVIISKGKEKRQDAFIWGTIPEGGTLYTGLLDDVADDAFLGADSLISTETGDYSHATAIYLAGQEFPSMFNTGDVFVFGDYEYRYNQIWSFGFGGLWVSSHFLYDEPIYGWGVRVLDDSKTEYGEILSTINGVPVVDMHMTFRECVNMKKAPAIPRNVHSLYYGFQGCESLEVMPDIPQRVTNLGYAFSQCESLKKASCIPKDVVKLENTFYDCKRLSGKVVIQADPYYFSHCFWGTVEPIALVGSCPANKKMMLAKTASKDNIKTR